MRRVIIIIVTISLIVLLSLPPVWQYIYDLFPSTPTETAQLNFKSLFGQYNVFIDGKKIGEVKDKESQVFTKIESGERIVRVSRSSDISGFYYVLEKTINFLPNTQVDIEWESGPTIEASNGIIRYFTQINNDSGTELSIIPFPSNAKVEINSTSVENNRILITKTDGVKVIVSSGDIYEIKEFEVKYSSVRKNVRNTVEVYLYKKPFIQ